MISASCKEYTLHFKFAAGTSRGVLHEKKSWFLFLKNDEVTGTGECSVIPGLSRDDPSGIPAKLNELCRHIREGNDPFRFDLSDYPGIRFGLETAMKDLETGGNKELFPSAFTEGREGIPLNGLIWMGEKSFMKNQIKNKINKGFNCIKMKIGALDFHSEMEILRDMRNEYPGIEIRLDANGAFKPGEALEKLKRISEYSVHSVEQPIKPGQPDVMARLCEKSPIPLALDEELIGISENDDKIKLLQKVKPAYIILKPGLLGGFSNTAEWTAAARQTRTGWWITSALESNIGLNAIAQWTFTLENKMVQGLGTGQLYENNFGSPLTIRDTRLFYDTSAGWNLSNLD